MHCCCCCCCCCCSRLSLLLCSCALAYRLQRTREWREGGKERQSVRLGGRGRRELQGGGGEKPTFVRVQQGTRLLLLFCWSVLSCSSSVVQKPSQTSVIFFFAKEAMMMMMPPWRDSHCVKLPGLWLVPTRCVGGRSSPWPTWTWPSGGRSRWRSGCRVRDDRQKDLLSFVSLNRTNLKICSSMVYVGYKNSVID